MKKAMWIATLVVAMFAATVNAQDNQLYQHLQDVSVTVKAAGGEGSGVIVTREVEISPNVKQKVNFVWTAAHVVDSLRSVRVVIKDGKPQTIVEFKDAQIVKELVEDGRRVGEIKMEAKVIKYSDAENGEDLALLMVRKKGFIDKTVTFYKSAGKPVAIGTELYHVGSLLGQVGSNSMTRGICSQVGRVLDLGNSDGVVFDQTTVTAFPVSSGGGVFLSERSGEKSGQYMGMLVRGAGETFNLIVPVRRMRKYAKKEGILWAIDTDVKTPSINDIRNISPEGRSSTPKSSTGKSLPTKDGIKFPILPVTKQPSQASFEKRRP